MPLAPAPAAARQQATLRPRVVRPRSRAWLTVLALGLAIVGLAGCTDWPADRAERDLEVGRVQVGGVRFEVLEGLAAVRESSPGRLVLWSSAPALQLTADVAEQATTAWRLEIHNALPDARLEATADSMAPIAITEQPTTITTRHAFDVELPTNTQVRLAFGPDDLESTSAYRFALMSDVQGGIDQVGDLFARINAERSVRFVLGTGDLTANGTAEEMARFQQELLALQLPYYTTLGNHDASADTAWHDWFGRVNFRFVYRHVQFSFIDSADATVASMVYDWLDHWLDQGEQQVHAFVTHIPPLDPVGERNDAFASRSEAGKLLAKLARGAVDVTLYGHIHSFYEFENAGIPAYISAGGGAYEERFDGIGRHFLVLDVDPLSGLTATRLVEID